MVSTIFFQNVYLPKKWEKWGDSIPNLTCEDILQMGSKKKTDQLVVTGRFLTPPCSIKMHHFRYEFGEFLTIFWLFSVGSHPFYPAECHTVLSDPWCLFLWMMVTPVNRVMLFFLTKKQVLVVVLGLGTSCQNDISRNWRMVGFCTIQLMNKNSVNQLIWHIYFTYEFLGVFSIPSRVCRDCFLFHQIASFRQHCGCP